MIVNALFTLLQSAQYLPANPWQLVNKKMGDDRDHKILDTKALSQAAITKVLRFIDDQHMTASSARLRFVEAIGLRSAELLGPKLHDLRLEPEGWVLQVHGKGARNCIATIPGQSLHALQTCLAHCGLGNLQNAPP